MKSLLMALSLALILSSCASKKKTDMLGSEAAIAYPPTTPDSATSRPLPPGADRMVVVETVNPDGSRTTTTTTEASKKRISTPSSTAVIRPSSVKSEPVATTASVPATTAEKKTGWSNRAKGAVIGGVGGAAAGALIGKKKGQSAVIGGVAGAAGGYIIGNEVDRSKTKQ